MLDCRKTVDDMYQYSKTEGSMLLSSFGSENEGFHFWDEYRSKHRRYDKLFNRMFNSFKYFMQKPDQTIAEITEDFTDEVYNHLMINAKKYEELYRVNVINDENYSITDNYNITETLEKETTKEDTDVYGERDDVNAKTIGSKNTTASKQYGQKQDTVSTEYGQKQNTASTQYGQKQNTESSQYGQIQTTVNNVKGSETDTQTNEIAGFNTTTFVNDNRKTEVLGQRTDTSTETVGSHTDSKSITEGGHTDSETITEGTHTDTVTSTEGAHTDGESLLESSQTINDGFSKGEQTDTHNGSLSEEYTLTRKGNIGVRTITEVLEYHQEFWTTYEFYTLIFKEICAELLLI